MPRRIRHPPVIDTMSRGLVRAMDALCRGASPPGLIDILHTRDSQLGRRFAMIARYDGRAGRWSVMGVVLSLLLGGVAVTGAVRGQDAAPAAPAAAARPLDAPREVTATPAAAVPAAANPAAEAEPAVADENVDAAVLAQLDGKLPELNFDGAGLTDVLDFLRDVSGANIVVEWGHLANAGVERNAPVSLRLKNVKFSRALDLVLSGAAPGVPVAFAIEENIIHVSTREHLDSLTEVRAYDVRDIVPAEMQMTELTKMILEAVAPDSWRDGGGSVGTVHASKHKLIVKQTPMNHREVRNILTMLREDPTRVPQATDAASAAQAAPGYPQRPAGARQ